ncbi:hypothetical protein ABZP36_013435 [Zizania latifolia]
MPYLLELLLLLTVTSTLRASAQRSVVTVREDDVRCLQGVKSSLGDPDGHLASWTFSNTSDGTVCEYSGISCWNPNESRIMVLSFSGFGLTGSVTSSLQYCSTATTLDLSLNRLQGQVPPALCDWLPFLVSLDLSGNQLSRPIPAELANCRFLNSLKISDNFFSGQIPTSLASLDHLKSLDLSDNDLDGQIPPPLGMKFSAGTFSSNPDLFMPHATFDLAVLFGRPEASASFGFVFGFADVGVPVVYFSG